LEADGKAGTNFHQLLRDTPGICYVRNHNFAICASNETVSVNLDALGLRSQIRLASSSSAKLVANRHRESLFAQR